MNRLIFFLAALTAVLMASCTGKTDGKRGVETGSGKVPQALPGLCDGVTERNRGDKEGTVQLTVQMDFREPGGWLVLYEVEGKFSFALDSVRIHRGLAEFPPRALSRGIYLLERNHEQGNRHPVILNPDEPAVVVRFSSPKFEGGFSAVSSRENEGLAAYYLKELILERRLMANKKARSKSEQKTAFDALISRDEADLRQLRCATIAAYPGTFLAKWLTWKQDPFRTDKARFWDNLDFTDASLVRTRVMHERMQVYFQQYGQSSEDGLISCIDDIVARAKANPVVLEATLYAMLEGFSQTRYDGVCTYLLDNYIYGEGCGAPLSDAIRSRASGIRSVQVGHVPPNIRMPLLGGGTSDLYQLVENHKYTLVVFWGSWCVECQEDAPQLLSLYEKYRTRGLAILAVGIDRDPVLWEKAVRERGYKWQNVRAAEEWKSQVATDYHVVSTPVMLLLDASGQIVFKSTASASEVRAYLDKHFR